jgi:hypothetical protein
VTSSPAGWTFGLLARSIAPALAKRFASHGEEGTALAAIMDSVVAYVASQALVLQMETVALKAALNMPGASTRAQSLAGMPSNPLVPELFVRPKRRAGKILDVPAPSTLVSPRAKVFRKRVASESPASAPRLRSSEKRLAAGEVAVRVLDFASDEEVDYGSPFLPTGARKSLPEFAAKDVLSGEQRRNWSMGGLNIHCNEESRDLNDEMYNSVLLDLPHPMPIVDALDAKSGWRGSSERSSAVIREIVGTAGRAQVGEYGNWKACLFFVHWRC